MPTLGDQQRVATPEQALADGADLLVVGRPITGAPDPAAAAAAIASGVAAGRCRYRGPDVARFGAVRCRLGQLQASRSRSASSRRKGATVALPPLTPEQRAAALEKAAEARRVRAEVKNRLKHSGASLVRRDRAGPTDDIIGKMKVSALLESMPGVGKVRARQLMEQHRHLREPPGARSRRQPGRRAAP